MDLSAPTDLRSKEGFTVTRDKRDWTPELAEEAAAMFIDSDSEIVLGDSVGLISSITEILSQPADVAILIASGNKGDDHEVYKQVIRKWKNFFTDVDTPLLVVVRSSLNPDDLSMFDPQDNYGVVVGLDRKAFEEGVINPQDACIEGMVFEIGQAFDLVFTSPMTEKHRAIIEAKWPSVKDIDTWTPENATNLSPEKRAFLSNLERNYFEQKRREKYQLGDEYRAETFNAYSSRFSPKNPNTRSKMVSRGRRAVQADPEYQQFRKYSFAGLGLLGLGFYLLARNSNSDNDSNNG